MIARSRSPGFSGSRAALETKLQTKSLSRYPMKNLLAGIVLTLLALAACTDKGAPTPKPVATDIAAGKAIAERDCKACHGANGGGVAPAIPHLAAQREAYLLASLKEYKDGKRGHAALKDMTKQMSDADLRNVAAYFASLPPVANPTAQDIKHSSPYEQGKAHAAACAGLPRRGRQRQDPRHTQPGRPAAPLSRRGDPGVPPGRSQDRLHEIATARRGPARTGESGPVLRRANADSSAQRHRAAIPPPASRSPPCAVAVTAQAA